MTGFQGKETIRFSETSFSPRFYGSGQPPYYGKPEVISKELINTLEKGMGDIMKSFVKEEI